MKYKVKVTVEYEITLPDPKALAIKLVANNLPRALTEFEVTSIKVEKVK